MKNKKTIVMGIIIGVLLIIIAVMGYVIASGKKGDSVKKETSAGTEEVKSADNTGDTTESSEKQDDQSLDIAGDFYAEIGHDTTWEADGKKCATESINIYNNTSASAKDWKLEITGNSGCRSDMGRRVQDIRQNSVNKGRGLHPGDTG